MARHEVTGEVTEVELRLAELLEATQRFVQRTQRIAEA
jgi:hypothetical protein